MIDLRKIQAETEEWRKRNFPNEEVLQNTLGVCEEAGELAHAVLKRNQGIRGEAAYHVGQAADSIGDLCIFLMGVCEDLGLDFETCIETTWDSVKKRDWKSNPTDGMNS